MQAARGASIDDHDGGTGSASRVLAHRPAWLLFAVIATSWYAVDQVTKYLAVAHLTGEPDVQMIGEVLQLHLTRNPGAAFGFGPDFTIAISILALVASVVVVWISRLVADRTWAVALGFLLAGIVGNFTDRITQPPAPFRGEVVDFLMLPNWPVFNVADICINVGVALVLLQTLRGVELDGSRHRGEPADDAAGERE